MKYSPSGIISMNKEIRDLPLGIFDTNFLSHFLDDELEKANTTS